jgi:hypothetical protein
MATYIFTIEVDASDPDEAREYIMDSTDYYVGFADVRVK